MPFKTEPAEGNAPALPSADPTRDFDSQPALRIIDDNLKSRVLVLELQSEAQIKAVTVVVYVEFLVVGLEHQLRVQIEACAVSPYRFGR